MFQDILKPFNLQLLKNINIKKTYILEKIVDLIKECIKVLGVHIFNAKKLWHMEQFALEGKIINFKSHATAKIVYLALLTLTSNSVLEELKRIQKTFL